MDVFSAIKNYVATRLPNIQLIHVGSTAIPDISSKPMIDTLAVIEEGNLRECQDKLVTIGFHRRDVWVDRDDKPYLCCSIMWQEQRFNINIHVCHLNDGTYRNLIGFRDLLRTRKDLCQEYDAAKRSAHQVDPKNPEVYNKAKEPVISKIMAILNQQN